MKTVSTTTEKSTTEKKNIETRETYENGLLNGAYQERESILGYVDACSRLLKKSGQKEAAKQLERISRVVRTGGHVLTKAK